MTAKPSQLRPEILISAYTQGYFPMPHPETFEIEWYRPDPRAMIPLDDFHVSRSLAKVIKKGDFTLTYSENFEGVMKACADRPDTWITDEFISAYGRMHALGYAGSVEVLRQGSLVGGVYGVCIRGAFFAESMFHSETNMSKVALWALVERLKIRGYTLLECQFMTEHLKSLGAQAVKDQTYQEMLNKALTFEANFTD